MTGTTHLHGPGPYRAAVLHGGPGGAGEAAPLAAGLAERGVSTLEPQQTALSVDGQVDELRAQIAAVTDAPIPLIGWSWGAWLGVFFALANPERVSRLVLVGSGPFGPEQPTAVREARAARLTPDERAELERLTKRGDPGDMVRLAAILERCDSYAPDGSEPPDVVFDPEVHRKVWADARARRDSGALLESLSQIRCPVIALHGDTDPHPAAGVSEPLRDRQPDARFVLLERCGHKPWAETFAKESFYRHLLAALP